MTDTGLVRRLLLLPLVLLLLAGCTGRSGSDPGRGTSPRLEQVGGLPAGVFPVEDRQPAPRLAGTTLEGEELDLSDLRGKVVVLNVWASWCAPCRAEARNLNEVEAQTRSLGVEFVGLDIRDDRAAAQAFQRTKQVTYPSLFDPSGLLLLRFRGTAPQSPPTTIVIDREGRVAARFLQAVTVNQLLVPVRTIAAETA